MATVSDITTVPSSGLQHIDALIDDGPGWNWVAPARNTLYYTFSTAGADAASGGSLSSASTAFNAAQQSATTALMSYIGQVTGINFVLTADGNAADFHFANANITAGNVSGYCRTAWSYSTGGNTVVNYTADAWIYIDTTDYASTSINPTVASGGHELLLHEIGHALGLKHPFDGSPTLPAHLDDTSRTLMSYDHVGGPYGSYQSYDLAALAFLYGGDGLGGALGVNGAGRYLIGTEAAETLAGGSGNDLLDGGAGNDTLNGAAGTDTARFAGPRSAYTITVGSNTVTVSGPQGTDTLSGMEFARFDDQTVTLGGAPINQAHTGSVSVGGNVVQGGTATAVSTLADADGLGSFSYRWQRSADGNSWSTISGATSASLVLGESEVGYKLRVLVDYVDGAGFSESAIGAASASVANVNDAPSGQVVISGLVQRGQALQASHTLADADGLGTITYRWQALAGANWTDIAGAQNSSFTPGDAQVGQQLRVLASYTDGHGTLESVPSSATTPVGSQNRTPTGSVVIGGTAQQGQVLSAVVSLADADGLGSLSYQWQQQSGANWTNLPDATRTSFTLGESHVGQKLRLVVNYTDALGTAESVPSSATVAVLNLNDLPTGSVTLAGTAKQGTQLKLTATLADMDGLGTLSYQWQSSSDGSSWSNLTGATGTTYTPGQAQVGLQLRALARYTDGHGTAESVASTGTVAVANLNDAATGSVTLSGTVLQGSPLNLTATLADADGLGSLNYQWQSSPTGTTWTAIHGATATTFSPGQAQVGLLVRAVVSYTDGQGTVESVPSAATTLVLGFQAGGSGKDTLTGSAVADTLNGGAGDDRLTGGGGNDTLIGGEGVDTAVYAGARASYTVGAKGATVVAKQGADGSDTLAGVERVHFADQALAFDLDGNAGITARVLGAVFGVAAVGNAAYAGIGLALLDGGMSRNDLMQLALETRLGAGFTAAAEVTLIYQNLLGFAPSADELAHWTGQIGSGAFTNAALANMAADLALNAQNIGLTGLVDTGLAYMPG